MTYNGREETIQDLLRPTLQLVYLILHLICEGALLYQFQYPYNPKCRPAISRRPDTFVRERSSVLIVDVRPQFPRRSINQQRIAVQPYIVKCQLEQSLIILQGPVVGEERWTHEDTVVPAASS